MTDQKPGGGMVKREHREAAVLSMYPDGHEHRPNIARFVDGSEGADVWPHMTALAQRFADFEQRGRDSRPQERIAEGGGCQHKGCDLPGADRFCREHLLEFAYGPDGGGWTKLHKPNGYLTVDEGESYWFAIQVSTNGAPCHWEYFSDAVTWDAETDPSWHDGDHGWELSDDIWFRPLPPPPEAE